jgi:hypothetical protein
MSEHIKCDYCAAPVATHLLESSRACECCYELIVMGDKDALWRRAYESLVYLHPDIGMQSDENRETLKRMLRGMVQGLLTRTGGGARVTDRSLLADPLASLGGG